MCRWCGRGERGGGDRRPDLANVELGGSEISSIGCEMLTREAIGREDVGRRGEDVSRMFFVESIVMTSVSFLKLGWSCSTSTLRHDA